MIGEQLVSWGKLKASGDNTMYPKVRPCQSGAYDSPCTGVTEVLGPRRGPLGPANSQAGTEMARSCVCAVTSRVQHKCSL